MILGRKKGWIGVDFSTRALKLVQVERAGGGMRIAASAVLPRSRTARTKESASGESLSWSGQQIAAAVALCAGFSGRRAACVLPMGLTDLYALSIPPGQDAERRAMVAHELSSMSSGGESDCEFDFWDSDSAAGAGSSSRENVNVLSVPRKLVSGAVRSFSEAGLSCRVMDGLPFALARAVKLKTASQPRQLVGAVDWACDSATFCVVSDGRPLFTRHLRSCGLDETAEAVSRALGLEEQESLQLLAEHGLPEPLRGGSEIQEVVREVAAGPLSEMADELNKSISYLRMQHASIVPQRLCLFGEGATVRNVTGFLSEKVGLPVDVWRLPRSPWQKHGGCENPIELLGAAAALSALAWTL